MNTKSWRTTLLGLLAIILGIWSFSIHWVPYQTVRFNLLYAETAPLTMIILGWALLHARDHRCK